MDIANNTFSLILKIWRQAHSQAQGFFEEYRIKDVYPDMSFLEMLEELNERLISGGMEPIAFDHDCHEGICGTCGFMINGQAHGPRRGSSVCQLHMRHFRAGQVLILEPWRSRAFPIIKDLVVDRSALDRIISAGGYISARIGTAPEANANPVNKEKADAAMDAAICIGCGACVAACPKGAAMLFTGAKISHLALLPQGQIERMCRVREMVMQMDKEGFGNCSNEYECEAACPKKISIVSIARMNREYGRAHFSSEY